VLQGLIAGRAEPTCLACILTAAEGQEEELTPHVCTAGGALLAQPAQALPGFRKVPLPGLSLSDSPHWQPSTPIGRGKVK